MEDFLKLKIEGIQMEDFLKLKTEYIAEQTKDIPEDLSELVEELSQFQIYPSIDDYQVNWDLTNNSFLSKIGLPYSAPSMIEFREAEDLSTEYICIGFNNYGDRIVVDKSNGNIGFINHDFNNRLEFMNSDAKSLFKSICLFAKMIKGDQDYSTKIKEVDSKAFDEGNWWNNEFVNWKESDD